MARSLEIPAVVGTRDVTQQIKQNDLIIVDGMEGIVIHNPTEEVLQTYKEKQATFAKQKEVWAQLKDEPNFTKDGEKVKIAGIIVSSEVVAELHVNGVEGCG